MIEQPFLEHVIRQHVSLGYTPNARGFYPVLCKVCHDHGKKGKRAGFTFNGRNVGYNCFNCGKGATFDYNHDYAKLSSSMEEVLRSFGVQEQDWIQCLRGFGELDQSLSTDQPLILNPSAIHMPPHFVALTESLEHECAGKAISYLKSRGMTLSDYPFYLAQWLDKYKPTSEENKWYDRLIIPFYKEGELIFWQGRDLSDNKPRKYLSENSQRSNVIICWDNMSAAAREQPLYVVEGFFDAFHIKGVGVMSNRMSAEQMKILNMCPRPKVVIPDKWGSGSKLAIQALKLGWSIATPDIGSCKDINQAITKYGTMYVINSIRENTYSGDAGEIILNTYCEYEPRIRK